MVLISPTVLTLPAAPGNSSTHFDLGDLTFNDSAKTMFIAGSLGGNANALFIYEYSAERD